MSKNAYQKPAMKVVPLQHRPHLLAGSGETPNEYDGDFAHIPAAGPTHMA